MASLDGDRNSSSTGTAIEYAGLRFVIATSSAVQAFFATVSYRLEPQGKGSRFPVVILGLYAGHLVVPEMPAALAELDAIAAELQSLPPARAIWSLENLAPYRARDPFVNNRAKSLYDYFVSLDGAPLVVTLRNAIAQSLAAGTPVRFGSPQVVRDRKAGIAAIVFGAAWSGIGYMYFPHHVIAPAGSSDSHGGGPLIWPIGLPILTLGILSQFYILRMRTFRQKGEMHQIVATAVAFALIGIWVAITWRN